MSIRLSRKKINDMVDRDYSFSSRRSGGGSGAGGGGGVNSQWVDDHYVSKEFFARLFTINGTDENDDDVVVEPNDLETAITNIQSMVGLWTESYLSALGLNSGGGGGGGSSTLYDLNDVQIPAVMSQANDGQVLMYSWSARKWINSNIGTGTITDVTLEMPTGFDVQKTTNQGIIALSVTLDRGTGASALGNKLFLGTPVTGDGAPEWRALAADDLPDLSSTYVKADDLAAYTWWGQTLQTSGQTKIVTGDITVGDGDIILNNVKKIRWKKSSGTDSYSMLTIDGSNRFIVGEAATAANGIDTYVRGNGVYFQSASGNVDASLTQPETGDTTPVFYVKKLKIGSIVISEDTQNHALRVEQNGLYADTYISALGANSQSGGGTGDVTWSALANASDTRQINISHMAFMGNYVPKSGNTTISGILTATGFAIPNGASNEVLLANGTKSKLKTINGNSIFGEGDIVISGGGGTVTGIVVGSGNPYTPTNGIVTLPDYLAKTGGTMTGSITFKDNFDLSKSDNNITETRYPTTFCILDSAGRISARLENIVKPNGESGFYLYARQYNTEGSKTKQEGLQYILPKTGNGYWTVNNAASFRAALGLGDRATDSTNYLPLTGGTVTGAVALNGGLTPLGTGTVETPYGGSKVWFKRVSSSEAPNNGFVIEYGNSTSWVGQLYLGDNATQGLYWNGWSDAVRGTWKKIAFTTDNVASATKLQNARNLWGQSFDGTANVSGAMSNVTNIDSLIYFDTINSRIGIGVSSPEYILDVIGQSRFRQSTSSTSMISFGCYTDSQQPYIRLTDLNGDATDIKMHPISGTTYAFWLGSHLRQTRILGSNVRIYSRTASGVDGYTPAIVTLYGGRVIAGGIDNTFVDNNTDCAFLVKGSACTAEDNGTFMQIGLIRLVYDSTNNALKVIKKDGSAANFYATGAVSALGANSQGGGGVSLNTLLTSLNSTSLNPATVSNKVLVNSSGTWTWQDYIAGGGGGGSVTSVGMTVPTGFSVSPSSITSSGTFAVSFGGSVTKNYVLASPSSAAGAPSWRALVAADIPDLSGTYATDARMDTVEGYFDSNGYAKTAAKLSTVSKKLWGNTYWTSDGVPTSVGVSGTPASLSYVSSISMAGDITGAGDITMGNKAQPKLVIGQDNTYYIRKASSSTLGYGVAIRAGGDGEQFAVYSTKTYTNKQLHTTIGLLSDGYVTALSDIRYKDVVAKVSPMVEDIAKASIIRYTWKFHADKTIHIGGIAQEWQKILPETVIDGGDKLSMDYGKIGAIAGIANARRIVDHETRIKQLERENEQLRKELAAVQTTPNPS